MTRPNEIDDFTQLITFLLGKDREDNTLKDNENSISSSEKDQLLSLYNGLHNNNYQALEKYIPKNEFTNEIYTRICLAAVQENGWALQFIHKEKRGYELCLEAVKKDGLALQFVPENEQSKEIYLSAVQENGLALKFVPKEKRDDELCLEAVKKNVLALQFIPEKNQSEEVYLSAVQENSWALELIPEEKRTYKICLEAVKKNGLALKFVPEEKRTYDLCLAAVKKDVSALGFILENEQSKKIYLSAVKENGWALQFIPKEKRDYELCLEAVKKDGLALQFVPENEQSKEIYLSAVQENGLALEFVLKEKRDDELCLAAVKKDGLALEFVPINEQSEKIYLSAVKENGLALEFVPEETRLSIINNIKPELILSNNYSSRYYFPYTDNIENEINSFLEKIEHIIVTKNLMDEEEKISSLVYGNKKERLGKTTHIGNKSVHKLLDDLMKINKRDINLVLIGLAEDEKSDKIAELSIKNIISLLEKYDIINRVTLLACHSAKSNQLNPEKKRLDKLLNLDKKRFGKKHGLVLATESFFKETLPETLLGGADVVYVIKSLGSGKYSLASVKKESMKKKDIKISLDEKDVIALQSLAKGKIKKGFAEFLGKKTQCSLRTKEKPLNPDELDVISSIIKPHKEVYSFLKSVTIGKEETEKLKPSLLKKLVEAIKTSKIYRKMTVKGYTQAVHVDRKEMGFHVAGTGLYKDKGRFFISPKKLSKYLSETMQTIRSSNESKDTMAKAIRVIIPPKK